MAKVYFENNKLHMIIDNFDSFTDGSYYFIIDKSAGNVTANFVSAAYGQDEIDELELRMTDILKNLGIPSGVNGYTYLRILIRECYKRPGKVSRYYEMIQSEFGITRSNLEKSVKSAIDAGCTRCNAKLLHQIFGYTINPLTGTVGINNFVNEIVIFIREKRVIEKSI